MTIRSCPSPACPRFAKLVFNDVIRLLDGKYWIIKIEQVAVLPSDWTSIYACPYCQTDLAELLKHWEQARYLL